VRALPPTLLRGGQPRHAACNRAWHSERPREAVSRVCLGWPGAAEGAVSLRGQQTPPHRCVSDWCRASARALRAGTQFAPTTCTEVANEFGGQDQQCKAIGQV